MSLRTEQLRFIRCDGCGKEHHDPTTRNAIEARIKAGIDGWKFRDAKRKGATSLARDACPDCDLPES